MKQLQKTIGDITEDAYIRFGSYVNNHRHIPRVIDGLKVSYKRLFHSALTFPIGKDIPTHELIAKMAACHPHGLGGVEGTVRTFVKSKIFDGEGNFGQLYVDGDEAEPASPRYTKVRLSSTYQKILGDLLKEVPWCESPQGALEPEYIPLPIPLCLCMSEKISGLGVGIKSDMPNFSAKSLYEAYVNNNPQLLEPNIDIVLDKKHSDLAGLWNFGKGKVTYSYHIKRYKSTDGKTEGILFYGDTGIFTVSLKKLQKLIDERKVVVDNVSDQDGPKMLVSKVSGARGITIEDIENICKRICYDTSHYTLNVSDSITSFKIPLYTWIDYTYKNYISLVENYNKKRILAVEYEIIVQKAIPVVVDYIMMKNPAAEDKELVEKTGISKEVISSVMSKPLSVLRKNKDTLGKIKELNKKLDELRKFNAVEFTKNIIKEL